jgi:hypothetical protein
VSLGGGCCRGLLQGAAAAGGCCCRGLLQGGCCTCCLGPSHPAHPTRHIPPGTSHPAQPGCRVAPRALAPCSLHSQQRSAAAGPAAEPAPAAPQVRHLQDRAEDAGRRQAHGLHAHPAQVHARPCL